MISRLKGTLLSRDMELVELETPGGVVYEVEVPLTIMERLPPQGAGLELRIVQVLREDSSTLYGFMEAHERELFKRLLSASGVGGGLAMAMLSTLSSRRLAQALAEKDMTALTQVSGVGKKKAERIFLELSDRVQDLALASREPQAASPAAEGAVSALMALGFSFTAADAAVRKALEDGAELDSEELIRKALASR